MDGPNWVVIFSKVGCTALKKQLESIYDCTVVVEVGLSQNVEIAGVALVVVDPSVVGNSACEDSIRWFRESPDSHAHIFGIRSEESSDQKVLDRLCAVTGTLDDLPKEIDHWKCLRSRSGR